MILYRCARLLAAVCLLAILPPAATGCGHETEPLERQADFTGFITEVQPADTNDIAGRITVESHADKLVERYVVTITDETLLFRRDGEVYHEANFAVLEPRQTIDLWFTGPILESFPMQETAEQVVVIDISS